MEQNRTPAVLRDQPQLARTTPGIPRGCHRNSQGNNHIHRIDRERGARHHHLRPRHQDHRQADRRPRSHPAAPSRVPRRLERQPRQPSYPRTLTTGSDTPGPTSLPAAQRNTVPWRLPSATAAVGRHGPRSALPSLSSPNGVKTGVKNATCENFPYWYQGRFGAVTPAVTARRHRPASCDGICALLSQRTVQRTRRDEGRRRVKSARRRAGQQSIPRGGGGRRSSSGSRRCPRR